MLTDQQEKAMKREMYDLRDHARGYKNALRKINQAVTDGSKVPEIRLTRVIDILEICGQYWENKNPVTEEQT